MILKELNGIKRIKTDYKGLKRNLKDFKGLKGKILKYHCQIY